MKKAILFSAVDREDYWVNCGIVFAIENDNSYEESYNEIKHKIESPEVIDHIISDMSLEGDLFDNDETYKFKSSKWMYGGVNFTFVNDQNDEVEFKLLADYINIF